MFEFERVTSMDILQRAWKKISAKNSCAGIDTVNLSLYRSDARYNLRSLQTAIASGNYRPYPEKTYSSKKRDISIHCVDDKIVQTVIAEIITSAYKPSKSVHGCIKGRSIYTAKKSLDGAVRNGITEYSKIDIRRFYDSIDRYMLLDKVKKLISDRDFLSLIEMLLGAHSPGVSTGSCLSPALANLYLADFDAEVENSLLFYSRYVDDMLIAPAESVSVVDEKLYEVGLDINPEKCKPVSAAEGFTFLGFDIKATIDNAIQSGNFELAENLCSAGSDAVQSDISDSPPAASFAEDADETPKPEYEMPNHIRNIVRKCHIVRMFVEKAETNKYLAYPEKVQLLQIFHCLGEDGAKFIHQTLSNCEDYDYAETQRRINKYDVPNPIGCKKLCERFGSIEKCTCNFSREKTYPTPVIHAMRVSPGCYKPGTPRDSIGHFKSKTPKHRAEDALAGLLELNRKTYEINEQKSILRGQIESLFERAETREFQTPQGLLIKTEDGIFIKVG